MKKGLYNIGDIVFFIDYKKTSPTIELDTIEELATRTKKTKIYRLKRANKILDEDALFPNYKTANKALNEYFKGLD